MLTLEELAACEQAAGDLNEALDHIRDVKELMWEIHRRQSSQLVQQVWAQVEVERDRKTS